MCVCGGGVGHALEGSGKRLATLLAVVGKDAVVLDVDVLHQRVFAVECAVALVALVAPRSVCVCVRVCLCVCVCVNAQSHLSHW